MFFGPIMLIFLRVSIACVALFLYMKMRRQRITVLPKWKQYLILGLLNAALPFTLIATAETHLSASMAAIINATTPLFGVVVARVWMKDALTARKISGFLLGIIGVCVLVGFNSENSGYRILVFALFSLIGAMSYAIGGIYSSKAFKGEKPMDMAIGQQLGASAVLLPFTVTMLPHTFPTSAVVLSLLGLAVLCTALAYLIFFALIKNIGPVKTLSVTFLVPMFGMLWGCLFLSESIAPNTIFGLVTILLSVALVLNVPFRRLGKREVRIDLDTSERL
jgi:drug/metabolite transporter (DMT)-like permease